jgi:hypothetical protein
MNPPSRASILLTPVPVTKDNVADTVIEDGFYEPSQICTGKFAKACREAVSADPGSSVAPRNEKTGPSLAGLSR